MNASKLKARISIEDVLKYYGSQPDAQAKKWPCLFPERHKHGDAHHSVTIRNGKARCWSQGCFGEKGADIFEIVGLRESLPSFNDQKAWLCDRFNLSHSKKSKSKSPRLSAGTCRVLRRFLWTDAEGHEAYHLRCDGDPKFRWAQDPDNQFPGRGACQPDLYERAAVKEAKQVILCEGERDADTLNTLLEERGQRPFTIATTTPNGAGDVKPAYLELLQDKARVYLSGDNDAAGQKYIEACRKGLAESVKDLRSLSVPESSKDWTDWQEQGGDAKTFMNLLERSPVFKRPGVQLTPFSTIRPQPVTWALEGRIPSKGLTLIAGEPDLGKSTLSLDIAAQWSRGEAPGDWIGKPTHVVLATCEDSAATTIHPRLTVAGADLSRVHAISVIRQDTETPLTIPEDIEPLERTMTECQAKVLIIDPVMGHLGDVDSYKDQNIRKALAPLAQLADRLDAVVLGIMHLNKRDCTTIMKRCGRVGWFRRRRPIDLISGSRP